MSYRSRKEHSKHEKGRRLSNVTENLQITFKRFDLYRHVIT